MGFAQNIAVTLENNKRMKRQRNYLHKSKSVKLFSDHKVSFNSSKYGNSSTLDSWHKKELVKSKIKSIKKNRLVIDIVILIISVSMIYSLFNYLDIEFIKFMIDKA